MRRTENHIAPNCSARTVVGTCLLVLVAAACVGPPVPVPGFFRYSRGEADAFLKQKNVEQGWVSEVGRNSTGSRLYLYGYADSAVILDPAGKLTVVPHKPSSVAYLNDEGQWAAWLTPGEAHFLGGGGWTRPAHRLWADRGARHYLVLTKEGTLELGTTDRRVKQPLAGFDPLGVFSHEKMVYVFGVWPGLDEVRCEVFGEIDSGYDLQKTTTIARFGWPASVIDMDLSAERVVVGRPLDLNPYWLVFDFRTGTLKSIGEVSYSGVFLREDLLGRATRIGVHAEGAGVQLVAATGR